MKVKSDREEVLRKYIASEERNEEKTTTTTTTNKRQLHVTRLAVGGSG